jgi:hypothetical protein
MAASVKRTIRKTLREIIEDKNATPAERLEACRLLWIDLAAAQKGKPRGRPFTRKANAQKSSAERIAELTGYLSQ